MDPRQTSFSDVCGTVDELKRLLREGQDGPDGRSLRVALERLLDDAAFMLRRMGSRIEEYGAFRDELQGIVDRLAQIEAVDTRPAAEAIASLRERVRVVVARFQLDGIPPQRLLCTSPFSGLLQSLIARFPILLDAMRQIRHILDGK